jgi:N-acetyl-gamma-glutamyl-phosphate reductase
MSTKRVKVAVLGASGYTGADSVRLLANHPHVEIAMLIANTQAGKKFSDLYPQFSGLALPPMISADEANWSDIDVVICGLPHGTAQDIIKNIPTSVRVIDMSADFRLRDTSTYEAWYGRSHDASDLLAGAVYGLSEPYRDDIAQARIVACPGCYPTAALTLLLPLVKGGLISTDDLIIDAKSGVTGAGRSLKEQNLFSEVAEGMHPYGVGAHRHAPEIEQELSRASGASVVVNFTPHLVPMNRGELLSVYARLGDGKTVDDILQALAERYADEPFVRVAQVLPATRHVRGSNSCILGAVADRIPGRVILFSALDNLVKGSAGQAVQNLNIMYGFDETTGLEQLPLYP